MENMCIRSTLAKKKKQKPHPNKLNNTKCVYVNVHVVYNVHICACLL